jgi:hypothetical protein
MALSARATRALKETLGDDAADDISNWAADMEGNQAQHRQLIDQQAERFAALLDVRFADFRRQTRDDLHEATTELRKEMHAMSVEVRDRFNDLCKWSFVFWCGAVAAVAALAGVLK